ncbi:Transposase from transposon Tn916 [Microbacterium sp. Bi98]|uniref:tyrosine-type recombinase/integrase n=1 Tax=Microbacterium sp. Bi98 TaxID=2821116 RepID=UPI001D9A5548|nr:site-specific integrase [Microbacterium sp. Bi98]CAH0147726.1 Transposase from transposon Tn916 [Microbacterium sp. Bi98]
MGTVKAYSTKTKGRMYEVWYTKPDGTRGHDRGFKLKRDAEAHLATVEVAKLRGSYVDPADSKIRISELGPAWLERHKSKVTASSHHSVESTWRVHVLPQWGHYSVGAITRRDLAIWLTKLGESRSHTTVARARDLLGGIFDEAIEDGRIVKNPARGIAIKKKPLPEETFLTHRQVEELARASRYPTLVRFLAYTGLRWGEATALRVRNVDTAKRRLMIREAVAEVNGRHILGSVKSHERRIVAYPDFLDPEIAEACLAKGADDRIWTAVDGGFLRSGNSRNGWFQAAVRRCMAADSGMVRVTPHDLRHTAASLAISAGANVKVIQRMLGHKSAKVTLDTYAALFPDDLDNVTQALSRQRAATFSNLRSRVSGANRVSASLE